MANRRIALVGSSGTVSLTLAERLKYRKGWDVQVLSSTSSEAEQAQLLSWAEVAVLCTPPTVAREFVAKAPAGLRILDTSSAHRCAEDWTYGLPELPGAAERIASACRIANPGCYATGAVLLLAPLSRHPIAQEFLRAYPLSITAVGGWTSGGRRMEKEFAEDPFGYRLYGMELDHRHVPEITRHAGLAKSPIFMPAVAGHPRGTLVQIPMDLAYLGMTYDELLQCLKSAYAGTSVAVHAGAPGQFIDPARMAGSDIAELFILGERSKSQVVLTAVFDNLGKGAAGAAEMNLCLMLGI